MDAEIPQIWLEVCRAPNKAAALAVLSQYLWAARDVILHCPGQLRLPGLALELLPVVYLRLLGLLPLPSIWRSLLNIQAPPLTPQHRQLLPLLLPLWSQSGP